MVTAIDRVLGSRGGAWLSLVASLAGLVASGSGRLVVALAILGVAAAAAAAMGLPLGRASAAGASPGAEARAAADVVAAVAASPVGAGVVGIVAGCGAAGGDGVLAVAGWWRMEAASYVAYRAPGVARALHARGMRVLEAGNPAELGAAIATAGTEGGA